MNPIQVKRFSGPKMFLEILRNARLGFTYLMVLNLPANGIGSLSIKFITLVITLNYM